LRQRCCGGEDSTEDDVREAETGYGDAHGR
jgi:hypothetical protein